MTISKSFRIRSDAIAVIAAAVLAVFGETTCANADENGVSFWLPGEYGSFAAIPADPGFSLPFFTYYYTGSTGADQIMRVGQELRVGLETDFFAQFVMPTYVPNTTLLGGLPSFTLEGYVGYNGVSAEDNLSNMTGAASDSVTGIGDLFPLVQLFWNGDLHNWMAYATGNIPVGDYDPNRLSNLGLGHVAVDVGGAYTYLNPTSGWEHSATAGVTFNFRNPDTDYTSGIDAHLDLGASKFLSERFYLGAVGFAYQQLTADSGQPPVLGDFRSRVFGVGPQLGLTFPVSSTAIFTNLRGYYEFGADNRVEGGSVMLIVSIPISSM